jgi:tRNA threonylcarbamoyladenosine biosynthesis protein TsaE
MPSAVNDLHLPAAGATELLGNALGRALPRPADLGVVLYLQGELGAGKTTCARSLLRALGVTGRVRSPTYTLIETYATEAFTCIHLDLYRLSGESETEQLGLRDLAGPGCLIMVEWPEKGGAAVPRPDVNLRLGYDREARWAQLRSQSAIGERWLRNLGDDTRLAPYVSNIT